MKCRYKYATVKKATEKREHLMFFPIVGITWIVAFECLLAHDTIKEYPQHPQVISNASKKVIQLFNDKSVFGHSRAHVFAADDDIISLRHEAKKHLSYWDYPPSLYFSFDYVPYQRVLEKKRGREYKKGSPNYGERDPIRRPTLMKPTNGYCGDFIVDPQNEECDSGLGITDTSLVPCSYGAEECYRCSPTCKWIPQAQLIKARCGDGVVQYEDPNYPDIEEQCDLGGDQNRRENGCFECNYRCVNGIVDKKSPSLKCKSCKVGYSNESGYCEDFECKNGIVDLNDTAKKCKECYPGFVGSYCKQKRECNTDNGLLDETTGQCHQPCKNILKIGAYCDISLDLESMEMAKKVQTITDFLEKEMISLSEKEKEFSKAETAFQANGKLEKAQKDKFEKILRDKKSKELSINQLKHEISQLKAKLKPLSAKFNASSESLKKLHQSKVRSLTLDSKKLTEEINAYSVEFEHTIKILSFLTTNLNSLSESSQKLSKEINEKQSHLKELHDDYQQLLLQRQQTKHEIELHEKTLTQSKQELVDQLQLTKAQSVSEEDKIKELGQSILQKESRKIELSKEIAEIEESLKTVSVKIHSESENIYKCTKENDEITKQIQGSTMALSELKSNSNVRQTEVKALEKKSEMQQEKIDTIKKQMAAFAEEKQQYSDTEIGVVDLSESLIEQQKRLNELEITKEDLLKKVFSKKTDKRVLESKLTGMEKQEKNLFSELNQTSTKEAQFESENQTYKMQCEVESENCERIDEILRKEVSLDAEREKDIREKKTQVDSNICRRNELQLKLIREQSCLKQDETSLSNKSLLASTLQKQMQDLASELETLNQDLKLQNEYLVERAKHISERESSNGDLTIADSKFKEAFQKFSELQVHFANLQKISQTLELEKRELELDKEESEKRKSQVETDFEIAKERVNRAQNSLKTILSQFNTLKCNVEENAKVFVDSKEMLQEKTHNLEVEENEMVTRMHELTSNLEFVDLDRSKLKETTDQIQRRLSEKQQLQEQLSKMAAEKSKLEFIELEREKTKEQLERVKQEEKSSQEKNLSEILEKINSTHQLELAAKNAKEQEMSGEIQELQTKLESINLEIQKDRERSVETLSQAQKEVNEAYMKSLEEQRAKLEFQKLAESDDLIKKIEKEKELEISKYEYSLKEKEESLKNAQKQMRHSEKKLKKKMKILKKELEEKNKTSQDKELLVAKTIEGIKQELKQAKLDKLLFEKEKILLNDEQAKMQKEKDQIIANFEAEKAAMIKKIDKINGKMEKENNQKINLTLTSTSCLNSDKDILFQCDGSNTNALLRVCSIFGDECIAEEVKSWNSKAFNSEECSFQLKFIQKDVVYSKVLGSPGLISKINPVCLSNFHPDNSKKNTYADPRVFDGFKSIEEFKAVDGAVVESISPNSFSKILADAFGYFSRQHAIALSTRHLSNMKKKQVQNFGGELHKGDNGHISKTDIERDEEHACYGLSRKKIGKIPNESIKKAFNQRCSWAFNNELQKPDPGSGEEDQKNASKENSTGFNMNNPTLQWIITIIIIIVIIVVVAILFQKCGGFKGCLYQLCPCLFIVKILKVIFCCCKPKSKKKKQNAMGSIETDGGGGITIINNIPAPVEGPAKR